MPRNYECVLVLDVATTDEEKEKITQKIKEVLVKNQGEIEKVEEWGKRAFAYPIKKKNEGNYLWFALKGNPELVKELDSYLKLNEKILRHVVLNRIVSSSVKIQKVKPKEMSQTGVDEETQPSEDEQS